MRTLLAALGAGLVLAPAAWAVDADRSGFRYTRPLRAAPGLVLLEPDGQLYQHARGGLVDLRVLDADGRQVPWRRLPALDQPRQTAVELLNRGRRGGQATALIDLGPVRRVHDRVELDVPDQRFVGRVEVLGSDDRRTFTRLSTTQIYDVRGARAARSTTAVFPPTDFRYLLLRASGISSIAGATVAYDPSRPALRPVPSRTQLRRRGSRTIVELDLGFRNVPVDELVVETATRRFDRPVEVSGSNDGQRFASLGGGRVTRFSGVSLTTVEAVAHHRYVRIAIENGDDPPLEGLRVRALARPRTILLAEGFRPPYRLFYGNALLGPPDYDFEALPAAELDLARARPGRLGAEAANPDFEAPADTRSFAARHPVVVQAALALAAIAVAVGGFRALRRRTAA